jgi:outer membrane protein OmpA-like peptidoglycan-associated protein
MFAPEGLREAAPMRVRSAAQAATHKPRGTDMKFRNRAKTALIATAMVGLLAALPALAEEVKLKGLITSVKGDTVTIKDTNNELQTFTISGDTVFKKTKGLTGVVHEKVQRGALMAGLPVSAEVVDGVATEVSFKSEDLKTSQQIDAGTHSQRERMDNFGQYESVQEAEVHFASGSVALDAKAKSDLMALAAKSKELKDFRIVLQGFTDSTGNAEANQRLSTRRAAAVANFLQQKAGVSPGRVMTPDGMGIAADAGSGSNAGARKVVAKLVIDKGVSGGN